MIVGQPQNTRPAFWRERFFLPTLFLWVVVVASALAVVYVAYDNRVKLNQLENLRREQSRLQVVWGQYLLEESTWAAHGRLEKIAQEKLLMRVPTAENIVKVTINDVKPVIGRVSQ